MAKLIQTNLKTRTKGEAQVIEILKSQLPSSWYMFYEPIIDGLHPDLVLFSQYYGVLVLEIKDYLFGTIKSVTPDQWTIYTGNEEVIESPFRQVSNYGFKIINVLSSNQLLVHHTGAYKGHLTFPVVFACVFSNLTIEQAKLLGITSVIPKELIITKDVLHSRTIITQIEKIFQRTFSIAPLGMEIEETVCQIFYPQIENKQFKIVLGSILEEIKCKKFTDFVDEILFVATEIRHVIRKNNLSPVNITIFFPSNRLLKSSNLVKLLQEILMDMRIENSLEEKKSDSVNIRPLERFFEEEFKLGFVIDLNANIGNSETVELLRKILTADIENVIFSSNT